MEKQHYKLYKSGKFWVTAMVSTLFLATMGATNGHHAHADDLPNDGRISFPSPDPIKGHVTFSNGRVDPVLNIRVNDQVVFCINPFAHLRGGEYASSAQGQQGLTADYWHKMTTQQQNLINNAAYLAQAQGAANDSETYFAGQLVVWSLVAGQNGIPGVMNGSDKIDSTQLNNMIGAQITGWDSNVVSSGVIAKAEQILQNAAAMGQRPNFSPAPLNVTAGKSATVTDSNGVLQNFKNVSASKGLSVSTNGNQLTVTADPNVSAGDGYVSMRTISRTGNEQPYYIYGTFTDPSDVSNPLQPVFAAKDPNFIQSDLKVNIQKANLKIDKNVLNEAGIDTKQVTNSNYSLAGNVFEVHKDTADGPVVKELTTDANGNAETGSVMDYGDYVVTEKQASQGLANTFTPITVHLNADGQNVQTVTATNKEVTGGITIQKTGAETGTKQWNANYSLAGNVFKIHKDNINGEVVDEVTTDANGYAKTKTDLPLGHYVVEEVQASKGFLKTFKPQDVDITYQGQNVPIVISATGGSNQEVKGQIIVDKSGAQSGKNMINGNYTLAGNEFDIFDEQNHLVDHVTTDASGKAYSKTDLPLGKYTVIETKASQGFVKSATPQKVDLSYVGQEVPVVFDTAYETNQEVTGGISIQKTGAETGTKQWNANYSLAGNVFKIHKDSINGEVVDEVTTDANGYAKTKTDLPLGHYVVEEVQASKGFLKTFKPQDVDITYQGQNVPIVLSLTGGTNQEVKGKIVIDKSGSESKKTPWNGNYSLAGNVFDIHQDNALGKVVAQITTDANGHAETDANLPLGDYYVTESKASQGYVKSFTPQKVTLKYAGQEVALVADMAAGTNQEVTGSTSVIKQDKQTGDNSQGRATLSGAEYTLYHADGTPVKWSETGQPTPEITSGKQVSRDQVTLRIDDDLHEAGVKHLALGDYYWQETKAPEGYQIDSKKYDVSIKYQDQDTPVVTQNETSLDKVITFSFDGFKYVKSANGSAESGYNGIQLKLIPINGTKGDPQVVTTQTDANGYDGYYKFSNIAYGDYELWEVNAPEGFKHIEPLYVHIQLNADKSAYVFTVNEKGQDAPIKTLTVPVSQINQGTGDVYLSKLFLFDDSDKTANNNNGGQPVININNTNTNTNSPVINNNPVVNTNSTSNGGQQHQEENQHQTGGATTQTGGNQEQKQATTTSPNVTGGDQSQTGGKQEQAQDSKSNVTANPTTNGGTQSQDSKSNATANPTVTGGATTQNGGTQSQDSKSNATANPTVTGGATTQNGGTQSQDSKSNATANPTVTGGATTQNGGTQSQDSKSNATANPTVTGGATTQNGGTQSQDSKSNATANPTVTGGATTQNGGTQSQDSQSNATANPTTISAQPNQATVSSSGKAATVLPQTGMKTADNPTKLYVAGLAVLAGVGLGSWQKVQSNNRKRKRLSKISDDLKQNAV
ncbi:SpaA isopeptide-forming pilin-related protein [Fructobacillus evanidus]|uniref:SpaA isopeptide-forming pilin-related protein n=1 Tax=Fructobacillus evanidus TaxID=3064281 RepID=UPI002DA5A544|nr:Clumping factor A-related surface protein [Fructobacillus sp. LMG 32999]